MIIKGAVFANTENVTVLEFGKGDVHLFNACINGKGHVVLKSGKELPLGVIDRKKHYKNKLTLENISPDVVMFFENTESIDIVIDQLSDLKRLMNENK